MPKNAKAQKVATIELQTCDQDDDAILARLQGSSRPVVLILNEPYEDGVHPVCTVLMPGVWTRLADNDDGPPPC